MAKINRVGERHGLLTVDSEAETIVGSGGLKRIAWNCMCDCGGKIVVASQQLGIGKTRSCGCLYRARKRGTPGILPPTQQKRYKNNADVPRKKRSPLHQTWSGMIDRCYNPKSASFNSYGGRGIKVCERWIHNDINFVSDMGDRPAGMTLDRKNVNGDYTPENCKWATKLEQENNRRNNVFINCEGVKMTIAEYARKMGFTWRYARKLCDKGMLEKWI